MQVDFSAELGNDRTFTSRSNHILRWRNPIDLELLTIRVNEDRRSNDAMGERWAAACRAAASPRECRFESKPKETPGNRQKMCIPDKAARARERGHRTSGEKLTVLLTCFVPPALLFLAGWQLRFTVTSHSASDYRFIRLRVSFAIRETRRFFHFSST